MTAAQDRRIAELERELTRANVRARYLESELAAIPSATSMTREVVVHDLDAPTEKELRSLFEIASKRWQGVRTSNNPGHSFDRFAAAFAYLSRGCSYSDKRSNLSPGSWCDKAELWLKAHRHPQRETTWGGIALAASCLGFSHSNFNDEPAVSWSIWLSEGTWRLPPAAAWRGVLKGEPLRGPVNVARPLAPLPPITTIRGGDAHVGAGPRMPEGW